jgi:hypothetical protein
MISNRAKDEFFSAINDWICDGYSLSIGYIALRNTEGEMRLLRLSVLSSPVAADEEFNFQIRTSRIAAGNFLANNKSKVEIISLLIAASEGKITIGDEDFQAASSQKSFETDLSDTVRWEYDLHLRLNAPLTEGCQFDVPSIDRELRTVTPPFDGLVDLTFWLGLGGHTLPPTSFGKVELRVKPPVDCLVDQTSLRDDQLNVVLVAHPEFNRAAVCVAVRGVPGKALQARRQVAAEIVWNKSEQGLIKGIGGIAISNAESALLMLSIGGTTIRRQWFLDPIKARSTRVFATKHFDPDMRQLKRALLEQMDGPRFERAVAALLFALGFSPAVQVETDAPDILVATPAGRLILVECTIKTSDFRQKLGKLVDRKNSLKFALEKARHAAQLYAVLVCRVPRDQLTFDRDELTRLGVLLLTSAEIENGLGSLNGHFDPDLVLTELNFEEI